MAGDSQYSIWINGERKPELQAQVSVFDSGFVLGDGVWEGVRVVGGRLRETNPGCSAANSLNPSFKRLSLLITLY